MCCMKLAPRYAGTGKCRERDRRRDGGDHREIEGEEMRGERVHAHPDQRRDHDDGDEAVGGGGRHAAAEQQRDDHRENECDDEVAAAQQLDQPGDLAAEAGRDQGLRHDADDCQRDADLSAGHGAFGEALQQGDEFRARFRA